MDSRLTGASCTGATGVASVSSSFFEQPHAANRQPATSSIVVFRMF
jgi:hypothetical protein